MIEPVLGLLKRLRGTILHPQWHAFRQHNRTHEILTAIEQQQVLDIGSGDSAYRDRLQQHNQLVTLDYPATNARYTRLPDVFGNAESLPFRSQQFDSVIMFEVLEHVPNDRQSANELFRVLKPGGLAYVSIPFIYPMHDRPGDFRRYTRYGIELVLKDSGFRTFDTRPAGNSFTSAVQLANLALMECTLQSLEKCSPLGLLVAAISWPITVFNNILSLPLMFMDTVDAAALGFTVIAQKPVD